MKDHGLGNGGTQVASFRALGEWGALSYESPSSIYRVRGGPCDENLDEWDSPRWWIQIFI